MKPKVSWWEKDLVVFCDTVEDFRDELVHWTVDHINESLELLEDADYVGYKITWVNQYRPPSVTVWVPKAALDAGGAWGRAFSTKEGREFVASREEGPFYWCRESPRYEAYGQVWFDP